ncbi:MAG TPA: ATP-binding protein, partial [Prolixibacteraceae bacterium]|nr:ATP-binding protein [Prolixibacteraceae bacterium]
VFVVQSYENEKAFSDNDQKMLEFISNEISQTIIQKKTDGEIRAALEKAEVSDKLKSAFLANMSHEIRTPLNSILGFSELLTDPEIGPSNQEDFVKNIKNSGKQLLSIISDILDYSLIEAGQLTLFKSTFCVEKVILDVYSEYIPLAQEKGFEFIIEPSVYLTETVIEKDKNRFRQSIANLVNNAFKFTKAGTIKIGYKLLDNGFTFSVEDSGIGIIDEFKPFVFERFQQAEKLKSRNYGGNGLGLAISKNLVERMGGTIGYESTAGVGSTFYISMPI